MPVVNIPKGFAVTQIEVPRSVQVPVEKEKGKTELVDRELKRSCEGALHLRPGIKVLTDDELEVVRTKEPKLYRRLRIVSETKEEREERKERDAKALAVVAVNVSNNAQEPSPSGPPPAPEPAPVPSELENKKSKKRS